MKQIKIEKRELECTCGHIDYEYVPKNYLPIFFYYCKKCYNEAPISTNSSRF